MQSYSNEEKLKFSTLIYRSAQNSPNEIAQLTQDQQRKLQLIYAQKIANEIANDPDQPPKRSQNIHDVNSGSPSFLATICCCFYPEQHRDSFDITTSTFLKRLLGSFVICKSDFLEIGNGILEFYGPLWLTLTYIILLSLAANLNEYFIQHDSYSYETFLIVKALVIALLFIIAQGFIYKAIVKCLNGVIGTKQSFMLVCYSLTLYFIPTLLCMIPSLYWHVGMLSTGALLRSIFLTRNYSSKVQSRTYVLLAVAVTIEVLYFFIILRVIFINNNGYNLSDGTSKVYHHLGSVLTYRHHIST